MSEMIERVARELARNAGWQPDEPGKLGAPVWTEYEHDARVAIQTMRVPTEGMVLDAVDAWHARPKLLLDDGIRADYQAMIDAALKD